MSKLLFEIGCEELPAAACREAQEQLPALALEHLGARPDALYIGPRRIAVVIEALPERTADEWVKGPPEKLRDQAAPGFAKKHGVSVDELTIRDGFLGLDVPGKPVAEVLPDRLAALVRSIAFGKSMRWGPGFRFARPVRWLCAMLDEQPLTVPLDGVASGAGSYGHRFAHPGPVAVSSADSYLAALRAASVEPDAEERRRHIVEGLDALGPWTDPGRKLEEVIYLVEWPRVSEGTFDERFTKLPSRVIETTMQSHQRYFPLGGNRFAFVANGGKPEVVRAGNEFVLSGRLEDAEFTYSRDVAVVTANGLAAFVEKLGSITYIAKIGTYAEKQEWIQEAVGRLGGDESALQAAVLAKADLASELVREFPELQGYIGAHYARLAGLPDDVATAIGDHYLPDSAGGPLPETASGRVVSAADKLVTLQKTFEKGLRPTGSRDPFGLRRAAIGLCRLAIEGGVAVRRLDLSDEVRDFVEERLEGLLDAPVEYVRSARGSSTSGLLSDVAAIATALHDARDSPEFAAVATAYERADRLAGKLDVDATIDSSLFDDDAERNLYKGLQEQFPTPSPERGPSDDLAAAARLEPLVTEFFDKVLVMTGDARQANRLALLLEIRDRIKDRLGDLAVIPRA